MVKIFDMHADLGLMLAKRKQPDQKAYFREVNLPEWQANGVGSSRPLTSARMMTAPPCS